MGHDLATVDMIRERLEVSYQAAIEALDEAEGDPVRALALAESRSGGGLRGFEDRVKEGVKRGLSGDEVRLIRWKLLDQVVAEWPVAIVGFAAVGLVILGVLITSSTVETEYADGDEVSGDGSSTS